MPNFTQTLGIDWKMSIDNHDDYFKQKTRETAAYFDNWLNKNGVGAAGFPRSRFCELYDKFSELNHDGTEEVQTHHNCIGCNLDEGANLINQFLQKNVDCASISYYLNLYSMLFYMEAERLAVIYKELGVTTGNGGFDWQQYQSLRDIKHWANLFKHPKAYMYLHHPTYHIEGNPHNPNMLNGIINQQFIDTYFRAGADNVALKAALENKTNFKVFFPDIVEFTKRLCVEFEAIVPFILNNSQHTQQLNSYTTRTL